MPETLHIRQGECVFLHRNHTVGIIKLLGQNGTQIGDPAKVALDVKFIYTISFSSCAILINHLKDAPLHKKAD